MSEQKEWGVIEIRGNDYRTVARRVADFRSDYPDWPIKTKILDHVPDTYAVMSATIRNSEGRVVATGHAYENAAALGYMGPSMLEVCETSAVGRALAFAGYGGSQSEIASADEIQRRNPESGVSKIISTRFKEGAPEQTAVS